MNLRTDNIRKLYFRYLIPSLFSGLVMSIYSLVDMIVVGQYEGAPGILRKYFTCLLLLPFNVYATYYLQAVKRVKASLTISLLQSVVLCSAFLYLMPIIFGAEVVWYVMFCVEICTAIASVCLIKTKNKIIKGR